MSMLQTEDVFLVFCLGPIANVNVSPSTMVNGEYIYLASTEIYYLCWLQRRMEGIMKLMKKYARI